MLKSSSEPLAPQPSSPHDAAAAAANPNTRERLKSIRLHAKNHIPTELRLHLLPWYRGGKLTGAKF
jgi:hypothetical protein